MSEPVLTRGFSEEARLLQKTAQEGRKHLRSSNVLGTVSDELAAVWEECRTPNWDGHDAIPVQQDTLRNTYCFLESLPLGFPAPSIGAEPDGALTLEWRRSPRRILSVSVHPDSDLHYAALFGPNRSCGTEAFFGEVPPQILDLIRRVYST
jgi:hypothetical protein